MVEIKLYTPELHDAWNKFVAGCKNSTFLHNRDYMDYHSDRFKDCSLVAFSNGKILAVLPANRVDNTLYSHQGLTYGGWLIPTKHFTIIDMLELFDEMKRFLLSIGINELIYKAVPHIYHSYPAEEELYAIFKHNGTLIETNISTTIPLTNPFHFNNNYKNLANYAEKSGVEIVESHDYEGFWNILGTLLQEKYNVSPVHSIEEIKLLQSRFPKNIRLFTAIQDGRILAGSVIFDTGIVAHAQYIASTPEGRESGAIPLLFNHLINIYFKQNKYLDFGISNEDHGNYLNEGLVIQKCRMGGRAIVHNIYKLMF